MMRVKEYQGYVDHVVLYAHFTSPNLVSAARKTHNKGNQEIMLVEDSAGKRAAC